MAPPAVLPSTRRVGRQVQRRRGVRGLVGAGHVDGERDRRLVALEDARVVGIRRDRRRRPREQVVVVGARGRRRRHDHVERAADRRRETRRAGLPVGGPGAAQAEHQRRHRESAVGRDGSGRGREPDGLGRVDVARPAAGQGEEDVDRNVGPGRDRSEVDGVLGTWRDDVVVRDDRVGERRRDRQQRDRGGGGEGSTEGDETHRRLLGGWPATRGWEPDPRVDGSRESMAELGSSLSPCAAQEYGSLGACVPMFAVPRLTARGSGSLKSPRADPRRTGPRWRARRRVGFTWSLG